MPSNIDMAKITTIEDLRERDAAIDALSEADAKKMLKSLVSIVRRSYDTTREKVSS